MPNMEQLQTYKFICEGGLDSNQNYLALSDRTPGSATTLVNFEPSLFGGYRRLSGYQPLESEAPEVDPTNAEGKILGLAIFSGQVLTARKQKSGATYNFYKWMSGGAWSAYTTGLTLSMTGIDKIRYDTFNFDGTDKIVFVDGTNGVIIFDGTNWTQPTGDQSIPDPKYVSVWKNTIFISGDVTDPNLVVYSAPNNESDWTAASGAGQINAGFAVKNIKPFRDEMYVFGETKIKKIVIDGTDFVLQDVTSNIGLVASDGVQEINGDILFLSQDGLRTIAGTNRIGDVELGIQTKSIQQDVTDLIIGSDLPSVTSVVVRRKSQIRVFFTNEAQETENSPGVLGGLKGNQDGIVWEWGKILGIRTSVCTSGYIQTEEFVIHGDYNGKVYKQEEGNSFDGGMIRAVYTTPYLDFGEIYVRKTLHKVSIFLRPEGEVFLGTALQYDWNSLDAFNPSTYVLDGTTSGTVYGSGVYGTSVYATAVLPILVTNVEGSGFSNRITIATNDTNASYSIQGIVYEYAPNGRK